MCTKLMNTENIFKEGTHVTAKKYPDVQLVIKRYYRRIYYCRVVDDPNLKLLAYFERELNPPA